MSKGNLDHTSMERNPREEKPPWKKSGPNG
jgi:hypothetical protein